MRARGFFLEKKVKEKITSRADAWESAEAAVVALAGGSDQTVEKYPRFWAWLKRSGWYRNALRVRPARGEVIIRLHGTDPRDPARREPRDIAIPMCGTRKYLDLGIWGVTSRNEVITKLRARGWEVETTE